LHIAVRLADLVTPALGTIFALVLFNAAMIGAATVTLASSYAIGDLFGVNASLNATFQEAWGFYLAYVLSVVAAAAVVLIPHLPMGLVNLGVQVLAGILLPSALGFLVLLCNDRELLGPWTNAPLLNLVSSLIVGGLLELSLVLTLTIVWPRANVNLMTALLGVAVVFVAVGVGVRQRLATGRWGPSPDDLRRRPHWVMRADVLSRPLPPSRGRQLVLGAMRAYLMVAMVLMVLSFVRLAH
jgi:hypothetical protein